MTRGWATIRGRIPITLALLVVAGVWGVGAWWSFTEQRAFADAKQFADPALLPLVIDGFAIACACVAYVASLDGRPAVPARLGTLTAVVISAGSNGWWAAERSSLDPATILMGVAVPIIANIAFEVLLTELRKTVQRARGLPAPVAVPTVRIVRLILDPVGTFTSWRRVVLELTALDEPSRIPPAEDTPSQPATDEVSRPTVPDQPDHTTHRWDGPHTVELAPWDDHDGPPAIPHPPAVTARWDDPDTDPDGIPVPPPPGRHSTPGTVVPLQVNDGTSDRPSDDDLVSQAINRWDPIPGIGTIRNEFSIGATRAGRIKAKAEDVLGSSRDDQQQATI